MKLCEKCSILMTPTKTKKGAILVCPKCGRKATIRKGTSFKIKEKVEHKPLEKVPIIEKEVAILPIVNADCPECGNDKAEWWSIQTRSSDEAETRFYRCTKCKHTWREYS